MEDPAVTRFLEGFARQARRVCATHSGWLVAVSGGADSVALLIAAARSARRLALRVEAACLDHGLRAESAAEVEQVRTIAEGLGVLLHTERLTMGGGGVEAAAREARYAALQRLRLARGLDVIATAHTADDQAETVLMRLARGSSLAGVGGILEARADRVVRPLLFATRAEVEAFVATAGVPVVRDPMNRDPAFLRTRVREAVLPLFEREAGPGVVRALARFASLAAEDDGYLNGQARSAWGRVERDGALDGVALRALVRPVRRRVMARFLEENGLPVDAATVEEALTALQERRPATLPSDRLLTADEEQVRVVAAPPRALDATSRGLRAHGGG